MELGIERDSLLQKALDAGRAEAGDPKTSSSFSCAKLAE